MVSDSAEHVVLYSTEKAVITAFPRDKREVTPQEIARISGMPVEKVLSTIASLQSKGLIRVYERTKRIVRLTEEGKEYAEKGLPEYRLLKYLSERKSVTIDELVKKGVPGLDRKRINIAIGHLRRRGLIEIEKVDNKRVLRVTEQGLRLSKEVPEEQQVLGMILKQGWVPAEEVDEKIFKSLASRNLVIIEERTERILKLTDLGEKVVSGKIKILEEVTRLTRELIISGKWKEVKLRKYDVTVEPPRIYPGKKHPYVEFLEEVRRILIGMGFQEARGPYVELEFYNFDMLFQAQDHPAREIHDSYLLKYPMYGEIRNRELLENVRQTHENGWKTGSRGWRYKWSFDLARRLILRTQTTAVSMRYLVEHKSPPIKMFCIDRVFRPDVLDATHSMEFCQLEGIIVDEGLSLKHLLGALRDIMRELGFKEMKFKPGYFPFTEPSVECFVKHPKLGWMEVAGSGLFRPEVLIPLGIDYPRVQVLAWGIGIERLAMVALNIDDIRYLRTHDLEWLRNKEVI
ncbi:MAG: phenylalanine--tRNA ligase subunit alpha [Candidatus Baldrarchaeia archaeon]